MAKGNNRKERIHTFRLKEEGSAKKAATKPKEVKHLEKKIRRYVVVNVDTGLYLYKKPGLSQYAFSETIAGATKADKRNIAHYLIDCYRSDTGDDLDLIVVPVDITYELIEENIDYDYDKDIADEIERIGGKIENWTKSN